ncbi:DNA-binding transcriptional LysR family regulator [Bosea sp. OAE752]|jgi:DNA-binding transcriptional LysR family regulator|uniref:LysR family transcriptional regulator n=1 Tax=unclassified Bosea (in: a-proteobacteria) TaxID=2653178 RepID=UPI00115227BB
MMDVAGLEAFIQIAEFGSFRRAAEAMRLSQTALSHRIRKLEEDVGVTLFQRTTRSLALTRAGQAFFPEARDALLRLSNLYDNLKREGRQSQEKVSVGCLGSLGEHFLPDVLREFRQRYPQVSVTVFDEPAAALRERVSSGEAQFALTILGAQLWTQKSRALFEEDFVAAVPASHPLAEREALTWADLVGYPLARVATTTSHGFMLSESLGTFGERLDWAYEVQRVNMAVCFVANGIAVTVLPRLAIPPSPNLRILPITAPSIRRTVGIIARDGVPLPRPAQHLQRMLLHAIARHPKGIPSGEAQASGRDKATTPGSSSLSSR